MMLSRSSVQQRHYSKWRTRVTDLVGMMLLFVTFTQTGTGGAVFWLTSYLPILLVSLFFVLAMEPSKPSKPSISFFFLFTLILIANISTSSLQYILVILMFLLVLTALTSGTFLKKMPDYAYYAMILNLGIYFLEVVLVGNFGVSFDATIFNYAGAAREDVISTWGFTRFSGHQTEPGSFAINLGGLTVLSLMGSRKPTIFHWLTVVALPSTLSITAVVMAVLVTAANLIAGGGKLKAITMFAAALVMGTFALQVILPMLGVHVIDYMFYRLQERGAADGSIYVKQLMIEDFMARGSWASLLGNRHHACDYCAYSKSLGFGFYMLFEGGLLGALTMGALFAVATYRLGLRGFLLALALSFMRIEFFFPQTIMMILAVSGLPQTLVRRRLRYGPAQPAVPVWSRHAAQ